MVNTNKTLQIYSERKFRRQRNKGTNRQIIEHKWLRHLFKIIIVLVAENSSN